MQKREKRLSIKTNMFLGNYLLFSFSQIARFDSLLLALNLVFKKRTIMKHFYILAKRFYPISNTFWDKENMPKNTTLMVCVPVGYLSV